MAIPETSHEDKDYSEYDSNLSENSVTTSDESEMTDLAGLFVESEIEAPEVVRAKKSLFTIISRLLFLVGQEFIKSKYFLALHIAVILRIILDTQSFCQCTNGIYALTSSYVPLFAMGRTLFQTIDLESLA